MGTCSSVRKTSQYRPQSPGPSPGPSAAQLASAGGTMPDGSSTVNNNNNHHSKHDDLKLGDGTLAPGNPQTRVGSETHIEFVVVEVGGIPRKHWILEKVSTRNGFFCEVWYENGQSKTLIYRTLTREPQSTEMTTTIVFNPQGLIDKYGENIVRVPRGGAGDQVDSPDNTHLPPFLRIQMYSSYLETSYSEGVSRLIGETTFPVSELELKNSWKLWMFDPLTECLVYDRVRNDHPMYVTISVPTGAERRVIPKPDKKCVFITRGTRGDVQPFLALARGLAEMRNWEITIVTEMRYRDLVIKNSKVSRGAIHFRPSGGDTEARIDRPIARWFIMQENAAFQMLMLARAEREFFESEPAFSYFIKEAKPDFLLFGFNTANIALILSESFRLPICGFILQPTIIPSTQYPAIVPIGSAQENESIMTPSLFQELKRKRRFSFVGGGGRRSSLEAVPNEGSPTKRATRKNHSSETETNNHNNSPATPIGAKTPVPTNTDDASLWTRCDIPSAGNHSVIDTSHAVISMLKPLLENNIFTSRINVMRQAHGLPKQKGEDLDFKILQSLNVPMICPINETAFGGRPADWKPCITLTDFIFMSPVSDESANENPLDRLSPALKKFILDAKQAHAPIVAIAFSSMPVSRTAILGLSSLVAERTTRNARVIAMVGVRPSNEMTDQLEEMRAAVLKESGKLIEIGGAPFGILFPFCDFLIVHGGLGTTGEALRAGKPCLITGVLLFDQRFWGRRVYELGCGPRPIHIKNLRTEIVKVVDRGLTPGNLWAENAQKISAMLRQGGNGDGIKLNVDKVAEACEKACESFERFPSWKSSRLIVTTDEAPSVDADQTTTTTAGATDALSPIKVGMDDVRSNDMNERDNARQSPMMMMSSPLDSSIGQQMLDQQNEVDSSVETPSTE